MGRSSCQNVRQNVGHSVVCDILSHTTVTCVEASPVLFLSDTETDFAKNKKYHKRKILRTFSLVNLRRKKQDAVFSFA